jgi:hypothetical protein
MSKKKILVLIKTWLVIITLIKRGYYFNKKNQTYINYNSSYPK